MGKLETTWPDVPVGDLRRASGRDRRAREFAVDRHQQESQQLGDGRAGVLFAERSGQPARDDHENSPITWALMTSARVVGSAARAFALSRSAVVKA
jgi:hypothetical protein